MASDSSILKRRLSDRLFKWSLYSLGVLLLLLLGAIVWNLYQLSKPIFDKMGLQFFTSITWDPAFQEFGALAFIYGTVLTSLLSLLLAVPVSFSVALFLSELVHRRVRRVMSFLVEMLAAIPSVIYGLWGIFVMAPYLAREVYPNLMATMGEGTWFSKVWGAVTTALFYPFLSLMELLTNLQFSPDKVYRAFLHTFSGPSYGVGVLTASIILAIMITPTITAISLEVLKTIPRNQKEAALALGSTRWEMIRMVILKGARSGLFGAVILGLGRALGETMAVTMVIGNRNEIPFSIFAPGQTMASLLANEYNEASGLHLSALAGVGLGLLLVSLVTNLLARLIVGRGVRGVKR